MNVEDAWKSSLENRDAILAEQFASCYSCVHTFPSSLITSWTDNSKTAICPHCGIDAVVPGEVDHALLTQMNDRWFTP